MPRFAVMVSYWLPRWNTTNVEAPDVREACKRALAMMEDGSMDSGWRNDYDSSTEVKVSNIAKLDDDDEENDNPIDAGDACTVPPEFEDRTVCEVAGQIVLRVSIPDEACRDVLTTAVEGGCAYWLACKSVVRDDDLNVTRIVQPRDREDDEEEWEDVDLDTVRRGVGAIMTGRVHVNKANHAAVARLVRACVDPTLDDAFDDVDIDAEAADCIVQAGMFGALVYG